MCLRAGGNGADTHKTGGAIERKHSEFQASQGAGVPQVETAAPEAEMSPEQIQEKQSQHAEAHAALDPTGAKGTTSIDPADYSEDTQALDHYRVAASTESLGANDSSKEIAEGHRKIAKQRAEKMSPEEHEELSAQLREHELHDDADHHEKTAGEQRALQAEKDEVAAGAEKVGKDVEERAEKERLKDEAVGSEFDTMMEETEGVEEELSAKEAKEKFKEDDPHAHAVEEWEAGKAEAEEAHAKKTEEFKAGVDEKHEADVSKWEEQTEASLEKYVKDVESHKAKVDASHEKKHKEWSKKKKDRESWEQRVEKHRQKKPEPPKPYTGKKPNAKDYDLPKQGKKFDTAVAKHKKAEAKAKKDKAKHTAKVHAHRAEGVALNKQRPDVPGKEPKHPGHKKGAPKPPKKTAKPKHPGHKKGAPEAPKHADRPKAEDFEMKKPSSASEKAQHVEYTQQAKTARENIQSHLENNPDLSDEDREKLQAAHEALGAHADSERMPTKEQSTEAKKMGQVAGKHGKAAYESPEEAAPEEESRPPETDIEKIQHADHKAKAQQMRDNIQSHLDAIQKDPNLSPEQKSSQTERLQQIHTTLEAHTQLDHMPTNEQASEMKELTKLAGEHGKKPYEEEATPEAKQAKPAASRGRGRDWAAAFGRGAAAGSRIAESARTGTGAGAVGSQALGIAAGGVASAGESLLHKPARGAMEQQKKQAELDTKAEQAARKKETKAATKEATVKSTSSSTPKSASASSASKVPVDKSSKTTESTSSKTTESTSANTTTETEPEKGKEGTKYWKKQSEKSAAQAKEIAEGMSDEQLQKRIDEESKKGGHSRTSGDISRPGGPSALHAHLLKIQRERNKATKEATVKGLYLDLGADLDLIKAVTPPNAGTVTESGKRAQRKIKESYAKHPVGVMGGAGTVMEDDPDVGNNWQHSEEDSVEAELEEKVRNQDDEEDEATKSVAIMLLKSLRTVAEEDVARSRHNPTEVVFMREVLGYNETDIRKGLVSITGRNRHRFHEWMLDRMYKSVGTMMENMNFG
jgi:hypothetical protein